MEVKTVVCPHCGANTTNTVNCDYCGSLFVRFADNGIDISNTSYLSGNIAFPELISEFKENLRLQKVNQTDFGVATIIKMPKLFCQEEKDATIIEWENAEIFVVKSGRMLWLDHTQIELGRLEGGICIVVAFHDDVKSRKFKLTERHKKFKQLSSFSLFTHKNFTSYDEDGAVTGVADQYAIDFGQDAEGAAILVSEIMEKVYDIKPTDDYGIFTGVGTDPTERAEHWVAITQQTTEDSMGIQPTAPQQNYPANEAQSDDDFWSTTLPMTIVWIMLALIGIFCLVFFIKFS